MAEDGKLVPIVKMHDEVVVHLDNEEFSIDTIGTSAVVFILKVG